MKPQWIVRGDIDGFFGLFIDNLLQLMLIAALCPVVCGFPPELVLHTILPGAAASILVGNLFYAWQARRLVRATGRHDVTALPYGINTVSLIAFITLIMGPIYQETRNPTLAWQAGLLACFVNGVMEIVCAFFADWVRRHTPRAAMLSALAGIAITFIAMGFVFQIFASPTIALLPMLLILVAYASKTKLPFGVPGGFLAVLVGVGLAWLLRAAGVSAFEPSTEPYTFGVHLPKPALGDLFALITSATGWKYLAVIIPMGLFNVIGSLQNLESAEAAGDRYETQPSLLVNGVCSVVAAFFGSAFPTTIYIGHPGWKAMGARSGYSVLNGAVIALLCLVGGMTLVLRVVPLEAALGILLWIGLIITAQAFQEVPKRHALAVGFGLVPALAAWALLLIESALRAGQSALLDPGQFPRESLLFLAAPEFGNSVYIRGVIALSQGFIFSSMVLAAWLVHIIDREFQKAALWSLVAAVLSLTGLIHGYELTAGGVQNRFGFAAAPDFALMYGLGAVLLFGLHRFGRGGKQTLPAGDGGAEP